MGDYDYGRANGLYGNDGIPYSVKHEKNSSLKNKSIDSNFSEKLALRNGFEIVVDEEAYKGWYFIKDGKKWIHNIDSLKRQLGIKSDNVLINNGYDFNSYYLSH